jgi:hypothetical protein
MCYARAQVARRLQLGRREKALLGLLAAATVVGAFVWLRHPKAGPAATARPRSSLPAAPIPRIDLARLDARAPAANVGGRDLFDFGAPSFVPVAAPAPPPAGTPPPAASPGGPGGTATLGDLAGPAVPRLPPLNLKYIGSVDNGKGVKVAVLVTDRNEVLTGQPGQILANRYRVARIGLESVDLEEIGSGQTRRIPLKGN